MSLILYAIFNKVTQVGSFQKAAEALNFTPSAISHAIARLEEGLGFRLFRREKTGVILTTQGEQVLPYIRNVMEAEEAVQLFVKQLGNLEAGMVRLGMINSLSRSWLPDIVELFRERFPKIQLLTIEGNCSKQEERLLSSKVDLTFVHMPTVNKRLHVQELFSERLLCIAPKGVRPQKGDVMTAADLNNRTFILANDLYERYLAQYFQENNISICHNQMINSDDTIIAMVANNFGISILPEVIIETIKPDVNIFPIENGPTRTLGIATLSPDTVSSAAKQLRELIIEYANSR